MTCLCSNCGSKLSYDRPKIGTCSNAKCRSDLLTQPTTTSTAHEISILNYLLPLVGREITDTTPSVPFLCEAKSTDDSVLFLYGLAHSLGINRNPILPATSAFLMDWPNSGYQLIETKLSTTQARTFGTILPLALKNKTRDTPKYLMDSFKRGLNQIVDKRQAADVRPNFDRTNELEWISVAQASILLKVSPDFLRTLLSVSPIDTKRFDTPNGIRTYIMVRKSSLDEIEDRIPHIVRSPAFRRKNGYTITRGDIERALNVSEVSAGLIIRNRFLFPNRIAFFEARQKFSVLRSDFDRFMENVRNLSAAKKLFSRRLIQLRDAPKFLVHASIDDVFLALISGTVHLAEKDSSSDCSLMYLDIDETRSIDADAFRKSNPGALSQTDRLISSIEAAQLIGVSSWYIAQLIGLGFIKRVYRTSNNTGSLLSYDSVVNFHQYYISDRELSLILNINRVEAKNVLIEGNVVPDIHPRMEREGHFWRVERLPLHLKRLQRPLLS